MTEYAELSFEVKQQWQLEVGYTLPATISAGVIPHKLHDITGFAVHDHKRSVIFKCKQHDSTLQQCMIHVLTFTFIIKCVWWCHCIMLSTGQ